MRGNHPRTRGGGADGQEAAASQEVGTQQSARADERQLRVDDNGKRQERALGQEGDHRYNHSNNVQAMDNGMRVGGGRQRLCVCVCVCVSARDQSEEGVTAA
jgi:hypothetical protein